MKTYAIPVILVFAIIAAGAFAFSPIDKATAVHNIIIDTLEVTIPAAIAENAAKVFESGAISTATLTTGTFVTLDCDADYLIQDITIDVGPGATDTDDEVDLAIDTDDIAVEQDLISNGVTPLLDGNVAADVDEDTVITFTIGTEAGTESIDNIRYTVQTSGDCDVTVGP